MLAALSRTHTSAGPSPPVAEARRTLIMHAGWSTASRKRFPFNGFTCFLTLFSKCFSSFLHSTCSLSVSCPYLALDAVYHPVLGLHSQTTRLKALAPASKPRTPSIHQRDSHPLRCPIPGKLAARWDKAAKIEIITARTRRGKDQFRPRQPTNTTTRPSQSQKREIPKLGLFPLRSPLLRESSLVSFPPLIDMLKFRGYSCLT